MSRATKILADLGFPIVETFGDLMGQFISYMKQTKLVDKMGKQGESNE